MRLSQYMNDVVNAHGKVSEGLAEKIHKALCKELRLRSGKRKEQELTEKIISDFNWK